MQSLQDVLMAEKISCRANEPLAAHSTMRVGGKCLLAVFPDSCEKLLFCLQKVSENSLPFTIVGNGSNLIFPDGLWEGVVIFCKEIQYIEQTKNGFLAETGASLASIAQKAAKAGLSGLEFAAGIPGTIGGALFTNAGAYGGCMQDVTISSEYYDTKEKKRVILQKEQQLFGYRSSYYSAHSEAVILGATLELTPDNPANIYEKMKSFQERRREKQPLDFPNAGSIFKRPDGAYSAGELIERCGLKGLRIGGAEVSRKHAGFIINRGNATAEDVKRLIEQIKETVFLKTGVALNCEVRFVGE